MHRTNAVYFLAGLLIAGSISFAVAEPFAGHGPQPGGMNQPDMPMMHGFHHPDMMTGHSDQWRHDPAHAVIMDMWGIEHLDRMSGRAQDLATLYNHVLQKTQNPEVRHYAYMHLARSEMKPANTEQAMATLQKGLDEDLANLAADKKN